MRNDEVILAENLARELELKERKAAWLAKECRVDPSTVSRILAGDGNPTLKNVSAFARALKCPTWQLLVDRKEVGSSTAQDLTKKFFDLSEKVELLRKDLREVTEAQKGFELSREEADLLGEIRRLNSPTAIQTLLGFLRRNSRDQDEKSRGRG